MSDGTMEEDRELAQDMSQRASTLYWNSDRSVNSIAEDLGLSKGRLYELIRPLASGEACPNCQSDLVFENRTAHERGEPSCPACERGVQSPVEPLRSTEGEFAGVISDVVAPVSVGPPAPRSTTPPDGKDPAIMPPLAPLSPEAKGILAGFFMGAVAGLLLGRYFGR